jgi:hypothetical protein
VLYCSADGATLQSLAPGDDLVGTVVADRYLITDKIGEGGDGAGVSRAPRAPSAKRRRQGSSSLAVVRDANVRPRASAAKR